MSIQTQLKLVDFTPPMCVCNKPAKGYCTDGKLYHVECAPCKITTPLMSTHGKAATIFKSLCMAVQVDRAPTGVANIEQQKFTRGWNK